MHTFYIKSSDNLQWFKTATKTLTGAIRLAGRMYYNNSLSITEIGIKKNDGIIPVARRIGFSKWTKIYTDVQIKEFLK